MVLHSQEFKCEQPGIACRSAGKPRHANIPHGCKTAGKICGGHAFPNPDSSPKPQSQPHSVTVKAEDTGLTQVWRNLKLKPYQILFCGTFSTTSKDV